MTAANRNILGVVAVLAVLVLAIVAWHFAPRRTNPLVVTTGGDTGDTRNVADFDQFQQDLATRVLAKLGAGTDFSAIVATMAYPVGTLLRATGSVPANLEDCVPPTSPNPFPAERLFPSYTMSTDTALTANLGSSAIQGLDKAGVKLGHSQTVRYTILDTQVQMMDDKSIERVTGRGNCGGYISAHPGVRLIRGAVIGKMTFIVKVDNPGSIKAKLAKFGFSVNDDPQMSTLSIEDKESTPIVELLSEFKSGPETSTSHPAPQPVTAIARPLQSPVTTDVPAHIFVQMDAQDSQAAGAAVVQLVRGAWPNANVESHVERIPTQKMPNGAQVRYFNEVDAAKANRCASILKSDFPKVQVVRVGLPSPKGQIEIWLPKTSRAPGQP